MRERLIKLLQEKCEVTAVDNGEFIETTVNWQEIADHLLANGVIVPPVKVGDKVYHLQRFLDLKKLLTETKIKVIKVDFVAMSNSHFAIEAGGFYFYENDFGKPSFSHEPKPRKPLQNLTRRARDECFRNYSNSAVEYSITIGSVDYRLLLRLQARRKSNDKVCYRK